MRIEKQKKTLKKQHQINKHTHNENTHESLSSIRTKEEFTWNFLSFFSGDFIVNFQKIERCHYNQ